MGWMSRVKKPHCWVYLKGKMRRLNDEANARATGERVHKERLVHRCLAAYEDG